MLGGQNRGYNFKKLAYVIKNKKIPNIVLFPDSGVEILKSLEKISYSPNIFETKDMKNAVSFAYQHCRPGTVCLLSTASPSYSLWKNFEEKGNLFKKYVYKFSRLSLTKPQDHL